MITEQIEALISLTQQDHSINDVYTFNFENTLKRIYAYTRSVYVENSDPDAIFYNISRDRSHHFAKNIDLDTKDLQPFGVGETNFYQAWVVKMKLVEWMENEHIAIRLNDLVETVSDYGSHIVKLFKDKSKTDYTDVNLRNIFFNPLVESIRDTDKAELHTFTEQELIEKGWEDKELIANDDGDYEIYEFWGWYNDEYQQVYVQLSNNEDNKQEIILEETVQDVEDDPYWDFHVSAYQGVWLRVGVVERLFELQEQANRLINYNEDNNAISSLLLLRTEDATTTGNILTGLESGEIINSKDLAQIGLTNQSLNEFIIQLRKIESRADELCFTPQIVRGEESPSGTPFRSTVVVSNNAKSSFRFIRERVGETFGYLLKEKIIPNIMQGWNKGEIFDIAEVQEDVLIFDEFYAMFLAQDFREQKYEQGLLVEEAELAQFVQENLDKLDREGRKIEIPKKFFNFDFGIRFNITGESVDKKQKNGAYEAIINWILDRPEVQTNPYFRQYVEDNGITPIRMRPQELQKQVAASQSAGQKPKSLSGAEDKLLDAVDSE